MVTPKGGEAWVAGTSYAITWNYSGIPGSNIGTNVKIDLLKDGQYLSTITTLASIGSSGTGSYTWLIPSTLRGTGYQIKITDATNSSISSTSKAFNIWVNGNSAKLVSETVPDTMVRGQTYKATVTLLNDGTKTWNSGYNYCSHATNYDPLADEWYKVLPKDIAPGESVTFEMTFVVPQDYYPDTYTSAWQMYSGSSWFGDSLDLRVAVVNPAKITVTAPTVGQNLGLGTTQNVTWTFSGNTSSNAKIELLKDGAVQSTIAAQTSIGTSGSGTYSWTIPSTTAKGTGYQIKVSDATNGSVFGVSAAFNIWTDGNSAAVVSDTFPTTMEYGRTYKATVTLLNDGTKTWNSGYNYCVHGTSDPFTDWYKVLPKDIAPGEKVTFEMTYIIGQNFYSETYKPTWQMYSGSTWFGEALTKTIQIPPLTNMYVQQPNGGSSEALTTQTINWVAPLSASNNVKIELYQNGTLHTVIAESEANEGSGYQYRYGSYKWLIPSDLSGTGFKIKVSDAANSSISDMSDAEFVITEENPRITVGLPAASQTWYIGSPTVDSSGDIRWSYVGVPGVNIGDEVQIDLYKGGVYYSTIISSTPIGENGYGTYYWWIPKDHLVGDDYTIKVTDLVYGNIVGISENFTMTLYPAKITITTPNNGGTLTAGQTTDIVWEYTGALNRNISSKFKIELYKGGVSYLTIATDVSTSQFGYGSYKWTVPNDLLPGTDYKIKVTDVVYGVNDSSNYDFSVVGGTATATVTREVSEEVMQETTPEVAPETATETAPEVAQDKLQEPSTVTSPDGSKTLRVDL